jgi:hypothetical protein
VVFDKCDTVHRASLSQSVVEDLSEIVALSCFSRLEEVALETRIEAGELRAETFDVGDERVDRVFPKLSNTECLWSSRFS